MLSGTPLRQSGTFVLVKSVYKPDEQANKHDHPRTLTQGDTLAVLQQRSFLLEQRPEPFALVQRLQDGKPAGELFWVSMRQNIWNLMVNVTYVCLTGCTVR